MTPYQAHLTDLHRRPLLLAQPGLNAVKGRIGRRTKSELTRADIEAARYVHNALAEELGRIQ